MKPALSKIHREIAAVRRGDKAPARAYHVTLDARGRAVRKELATEAFRRAQAAAGQREEERNQPQAGLIVNRNRSSSGTWLTIPEHGQSVSQ